MEGLIHRAHLVGFTRGPRRNDEGAYDDVPYEGPWFAARIMEVTNAPAKGRRRPESTDARAVAPYEILADAVDEDGVPVVLTASSRLETECDVLGSPTLELAGKPEKLNDGEEHIGWYGRANVPKDAA